MVNNILFLVGKQSDTYPVKYTSRKAPKWLKEGAKIFEEFTLDRALAHFNTLQTLSQR